MANVNKKTLAAISLTVAASVMTIAVALAFQTTTATDTKVISEPSIMQWSVSPKVEQVKVPIGDSVTVPIQLEAFNNATMDLDLEVNPTITYGASADDPLTGNVTIPGLLVALDKSSVSVSEQDVADNKVRDIGDGWGERDIAVLTVTALGTAKAGTYEFELTAEQDLGYGTGHGVVYPIQIAVVEKG